MKAARETPAGGPSAVEPIAFSSALRRRELMWLGVRLVLWNRVVLTVMLSGPVLWIVGRLTHGASATGLGVTFSWMLIVIPAVALLAGNWSAYSPGASELLEPVDWVFAERGVEIRQPSAGAFAEWSEFRAWRREGAHYLLYSGFGRYIVVPVAAVPVERREDFEALLARSIRRGRR